MTDLQRIDNAALIGGRHAYVVVKLARDRIRQTLDAGGRPTPELPELVQTLQPVADQWATSAERSSEAVPSEVSAQWAHDDETDQIDTAQAADLLGVSTRRVVQLLDAQRLTGHKRAGVWFVDRHSVLAYAEDRDP